MDIKCKKTSCGHNDCTVCMANGILIGANLDCETFTLKKIAQKSVSSGKKNMFEASEELTKYKPNKSLKVDCNATNCLFNDQCQCKANGISVLCKEECGICGTHIKK